jgi:trimeric autotransporter adhesin
MKKTIILGFLMTAHVWSAYAQQNTHYGIGTVSIGSGNSFFGWYSGHDCNASSLGNSFFGEHSGRYTTSGIQNSYFGALCGSANETGNQNTAMGFRALTFNETGSLNVAIGYMSLDFNRGDENTAVGAAALRENSHGDYNTAVGSGALYYNESSRNTATGRKSLYNNTTGHSNTANGYHSLQANTTGYYNVAIGSQSMYANVDGVASTATGYFALANNTSGSYNSASGFRALQYNTTGANNTAHGSKALYFITTGGNNTAIGSNAGPFTPDLSNTTAVGYLAVPTASNQVRIGNAAVTSIGGQVEWTAFSDGRFKKDIKEDVSGLDFIKHLRPVSYVVDKTEVNKFLHVTDSTSSQTETKIIPMRQTGFIAQEVEALVKKTGYVFYGVDAPKNENDPYGIRYAAFVVPLVKAVQELSANVEEQKTLIEQQQKQIEVLLAGLNSKIEIENKEVSGASRAFLLQNSPNPFTSETEIRMTLGETVGNATVMIYSLEGKEMKRIPVRDRGEVSVRISGNELPAGVYLYSLIFDGKVVDTKRMILTE